MGVFALALLSTNANRVGLCGDTGDGDVAIQIARDRVLLLTEDPIQSNYGWHEQGFALSDATGQHVIFSLKGKQALDILAQGTAAILDDTSPSATIEFFGQNALLVKKDSAYHLYIDTAMQTTITAFLKNCSTPDTP